MTIRSSAMEDREVVPFEDTLAPVAMLLGGIPVLTALVMTAVRYVASGSL